MTGTGTIASPAYDEALQLADTGGDGNVVMSLLQRASQEGDHRAKYAVATWLLSGQEGVVEKDVKAGVKLLKELEDGDLPEALFDLAVSYDYGWVSRRNAAKAFSLYMRAALLGDAEACRQMAGFYEEGKDVKHDRRLAEAWRKRAETGEKGEKEISPPYRVWLRPPAPTE